MVDIQFLSASCSVSSPSPSPWLSAVHSCNAQKETIREKPQVETHSWRAQLWWRHAYRQVVTEQLHDQGAVFLGIGLKSIQHGDGFIEGLEDTAHTVLSNCAHALRHKREVLTRTAASFCPLGQIWYTSQDARHAHKRAATCSLSNIMTVVEAAVHLYRSYTGLSVQNPQTIKSASFQKTIYRGRRGRVLPFWPDCRLFPVS